MILIKLLAFLCVASSCGFIYTLVEFKVAKKTREKQKMNLLVDIAIASVFTMIIASLPLAFYILTTR